MNIMLIGASSEYKNVIKNLMQFYVYDFSIYIGCDVERDGLYAEYADLDDYWREPNHRFPYMIIKEKKYLGFVLVRFIESAERAYFSIAEFFILNKYRRQGIGKMIALQIFNLHRGQWEVFQKESNKPAQAFWSTVINEYTGGKFTERFENGRRIQDFEN